MCSKVKYFKDHILLKNNYSGMHFYLPITMVRTPSHFVHVRILFKKILDKMQVKMIFELDNIWNDEGVVKLSPKNIKHLYVKCKIDAGKKIKGLNLEDLYLDFSFSSVSSSSEKWPFIAFHRKKRSKQENSPTESPQHWTNGCLNTVTVPFFPSDSNVLEYLK